MTDFIRIIKNHVVKIRNCQLSLSSGGGEFGLERCSLEWMRLEETTDSDRRYCGQCNTSVHFCYDDEDIARNIKQGNCIAFLNNTKAEIPEMLMGAPTMSDLNNKPLTE